MSLAQTKFCQSCGAVGTGARFCDACGAPMEVAATQPVAGFTPTQPDQSGVPAAIAWIPAGDVPVSRVLWILAAVTGFLASSGFSLFLPSVYFSGTFGVGSVVLTLAFLGIGGAAAFLDAPSLGTKIGSIALVAGAAVIPALFGFSLTTVLLFLAWAVATRLRGLGYVGVAIVAVGGIILAVIGYALAYPASVIAGFVFLVSYVALPIGAAIVAGKLSDRSRIAAANRPAPMPYTPTASAYAQPAYGQAAYAPGAPAATAGYPPAGYAPAGTGYPQKTNTLAIIALITTLFASTFIGAILAATALKQIQRTGEGGKGIATAALVIGWVSFGIGAIFVIGLLIFVAANS
jgi:hypothetical protein